MSGSMELDSTALSDATGTLDGVCFRVGEAWYETKSGTCSDRVLEDEQSFESVGEVIEDTSGN